MPRRIHILADAQIYHVYNRSVGKEYIFNKLTYLNHALELIDFYRFNQRLRYSKFRDLNKDFRAEYENNFRKQNPIIEIYSFAFMPNHFHFLLKQMHSDGIMNFTRKLQTSFSKFFNLKNDRHGNLFESSFKAKRVDTDEEFWHVSRYIHLNPVTAFLIDYNQLEDYPWTSFPFYAKR